MKVYSPSEIADLLQLKVSTIRKYSIMLEDLGYKFEKNSRNQRFYTDADVITLRKFVTFKDNGMTLTESAESVMLWHNGNESDQGDITPPLTYEQDVTQHYNEDIQEMKSMIQQQTEMIHKQNETIEKLAERLDKQEQRAEERDQAVMQSLNESLETQKQIAAESEKENKGFFARLFNR